MRMDFEETHNQRAAPAADVDNAAEPREVVRFSHCPRRRRRVEGHELVENCALVGMPPEVFEELDPMDLVECWFSRPNTVQEVTPGAPWRVARGGEDHRS